MSEKVPCEKSSMFFSGRFFGNVPVINGDSKLLEVSTMVVTSDIHNSTLNCSPSKPATSCRGAEVQPTTQEKHPLGSSSQVG